MSGSFEPGQGPTRLLDRGLIGCLSPNNSAGHHNPHSGWNSEISSPSDLDSSARYSADWHCSCRLRILSSEIGHSDSTHFTCCNSISDCVDVNFYKYNKMLAVREIKIKD